MGPDARADAIGASILKKKGHSWKVQDKAGEAVSFRPTGLVYTQNDHVNYLKPSFSSASLLVKAFGSLSPNWL
jgi:hypothetical protein